MSLFQSQGPQIPESAVFPEMKAGFAPINKPLAEKYRPQQIADFIGLDKVKKIVGNFASRPCASAWAFVGPSGTGKTSMAQALCEAIQGEFHHIPSQKCDARAIDEVVRICWYAPMVAGSFHVVVVDEFDHMTEGAQLALLSKLDSTAAPPQTIWIFTGNSTDGMEKRFLSRCRVLEFSSYGMREDLANLLARVWEVESGTAGTLDFSRMAKDACNNVRDALMHMEIELLAR